jgi:hypothetical protein
LQSIDKVFKQAVEMEPRLQRELPEIIRAYKLTGLERRLEQAIREASSNYLYWWGDHPDGKLGLGSKAPILAMRNELRSILSSLKNRQLRNRLLAAAPGSAREKRKCLRQLPEALESVLKVVDHASAIDGRELNGPRRDDIRAAAAPLRRFWTVDAKRKEALFLREGRYPEKVEYSETVRFLYDCLSIIDSSVTSRMLVDLDLNNGNS